MSQIAVSKIEVASTFPDLESVEAAAKLAGCQTQLRSGVLHVSSNSSSGNWAWVEFRVVDGRVVARHDADEGIRQRGEALVCRIKTWGEHERVKKEILQNDGFEIVSDTVDELGNPVLEVVAKAAVGHGGF